LSLTLSLSNLSLSDVLAEMLSDDSLLLKDILADSLAFTSLCNILLLNDSLAFSALVLSDSDKSSLACDAISSAFSLRLI